MSVQQTAEAGRSLGVAMDVALAPTPSFADGLQIQRVLDAVWTEV